MKSYLVVLAIIIITIILSSSLLVSAAQLNLLVPLDQAHFVVTERFFPADDIIITGNVQTNSTSGTSCSLTFTDCVFLSLSVRATFAENCELIIRNTTLRTYGLRITGSFAASTKILIDGVSSNSDVTGEQFALKIEPSPLNLLSSVIVQNSMLRRNVPSGSTASISVDNCGGDAGNVILSTVCIVPSSCPDLLLPLTSPGNSRDPVTGKLLCPNVMSNNNNNPQHREIILRNNNILSRNWGAPSLGAQPASVVAFPRTTAFPPCPCFSLIVDRNSISFTGYDSASLNNHNLNVMGAGLYIRDVVPAKIHYSNNEMTLKNGDQLVGIQMLYASNPSLFTPADMGSNVLALNSVQLSDNNTFTATTIASPTPTQARGAILRSFFFVLKADEFVVQASGSFNISSNSNFTVGGTAEATLLSFQVFQDESSFAGGFFCDNNPNIQLQSYNAAAFFDRVPVVNMSTVSITNNFLSGLVRRAASPGSAIYVATWFGRRLFPTKGLNSLPIQSTQASVGFLNLNLFNFSGNTVMLDGKNTATLQQVTMMSIVTTLQNVSKIEINSNDVEMWGGAQANTGILLGSSLIDCFVVETSDFDQEGGQNQMMTSSFVPTQVEIARNTFFQRVETVDQSDPNLYPSLQSIYVGMNKLGAVKIFNNTASIQHNHDSTSLFFVRVDFASQEATNTTGKNNNGFSRNFDFFLGTATNGQGGLHIHENVVTNILGDTSNTLFLAFNGWWNNSNPNFDVADQKSVVFEGGSKLLVFKNSFECSTRVAADGMSYMFFVLYTTKSLVFYGIDFVSFFPLLYIVENDLTLGGRGGIDEFSHFYSGIFLDTQLRFFDQFSTNFFRSFLPFFANISGNDLFVRPNLLINSNPRKVRATAVFLAIKDFDFDKTQSILISKNNFRVRQDFILVRDPDAFSPNSTSSGVADEDKPSSAMHLVSSLTGSQYGIRNVKNFHIIDNQMRAPTQYGVSRIANLNVIFTSNPSSQQQMDQNDAVFLEIVEGGSLVIQRNILVCDRSDARSCGLLRIGSHELFGDLTVSDNQIGFPSGLLYKATFFRDELTNERAKPSVSSVNEENSIITISKHKLYDAFATGRMKKTISANVFIENNHLRNGFTFYSFTPIGVLQRITSGMTAENVQPVVISNFVLFGSVFDLRDLPASTPVSSLPKILVRNNTIDGVATSTVDPLANQNRLDFFNVTSSTFFRCHSCEMMGKSEQLRAQIQIENNTFNAQILSSIPQTRTSSSDPLTQTNFFALSSAISSGAASRQLSQWKGGDSQIHITDNIFNVHPSTNTSKVIFISLEDRDLGFLTSSNIATRTFLTASKNSMTIHADTELSDISLFASRSAACELSNRRLFINDNILSILDTSRLTLTRASSISLASILPLTSTVADVPSLLVANNVIRNSRLSVSASSAYPSTDATLFCFGCAGSFESTFLPSSSICIPALANRQCVYSFENNTIQSTSDSATLTPPLPTLLNVPSASAPSSFGQAFLEVSGNRLSVSSPSSIPQMAGAQTPVAMVTERNLAAANSNLFGGIRDITLTIGTPCNKLQYVDTQTNEAISSSFLLQYFNTAFDNLVQFPASNTENAMMCDSKTVSLTKLPTPSKSIEETKTLTKPPTRTASRTITTIIPPFVPYGLDAETQQIFQTTTGTIGIAAGIGSPTAPAVVARALSSFALVGCPRFSPEGVPWIEAPLNFPDSFFPGVSMGPAKGGYARAAIVSFIAAVILTVSASLVIGIIDFYGVKFFLRLKCKFTSLEWWLNLSGLAPIPHLLGRCVALLIAFWMRAMGLLVGGADVERLFLDVIVMSLFPTGLLLFCTVPYLRKFGDFVVNGAGSSTFGVAPSICALTPAQLLIERKNEAEKRKKIEKQLKKEMKKAKKNKKNKKKKDDEMNNNNTNDDHEQQPPPEMMIDGIPFVIDDHDHQDDENTNNNNNNAAAADRNTPTSPSEIIVPLTRAQKIRNYLLSFFNGRIGRFIFIGNVCWDPVLEGSRAWVLQRRSRSLFRFWGPARRPRGEEMKALRAFVTLQQEQQKKIVEAMEKSLPLPEDGTETGQPLALEFEATAIDDPESKVSLRFKLTPLNLLFNIFFAILVSFFVGIAQTRPETCPDVIRWIAFVNGFVFVFNAWQRPYIVPFVNILQSSMDLCAMVASILAANAQSAFEQEQARQQAEFEAGKIEQMDSRPVIDASATFIQLFVTISLSVLSLVLLSSRVFPFVSLRLFGCLIQPKRVVRASEKINFEEDDQDNNENNQKKKDGSSEEGESSSSEKIKNLSEMMNDENEKQKSKNADDDEETSDDDSQGDGKSATEKLKDLDAKDDALRDLLNNDKNDDNAKNPTNEKPSADDDIVLASAASSSLSVPTNNNNNNLDSLAKTSSFSSSSSPSHKNSSNNDSNTKKKRPPPTVMILDLAEIDEDLSDYSRQLLEKYSKERAQSRLEEEQLKRQKQEEEYELQQKQLRDRALHPGRPLSERLFAYHPPKVPDHLPNPDKADIRGDWEKRFDEMDDLLRTAHEFAQQAQDEMDDEDDRRHHRDHQDDDSENELQEQLLLSPTAKNNHNNSLKRNVSFNDDEEMLEGGRKNGNKKKSASSNSNSKKKTPAAPQQHEKFKLHMQMDDFLGI